MTPNPCPAVPFLVVIIITPLLAREPYKAAADAPFKTLIDSISAGLIEDIPSPESNPHVSALPSEPCERVVEYVLSIGTPSTTINA